MSQTELQSSRKSETVLTQYADREIPPIWWYGLSTMLSARVADSCYYQMVNVVWMFQVQHSKKLPQLNLTNFSTGMTTHLKQNVSCRKLWLVSSYFYVLTAAQY